MHCTAMVCHALHDRGLSCITQQGFVISYPSRVCTHYTSSVCHALHDKGLLYITDQQFLYSTDSALNVAWVCSDTYRLGSVVGAGVVGSGVVVGASEVLKGVVVGD